MNPEEYQDAVSNFNAEERQRQTREAEERQRQTERQRQAREAEERQRQAREAEERQRQAERHRQARETEERQRRDRERSARERAAEARAAEARRKAGDQIPILPQRANESNEPPAEYLCPILMDVMTDPVICADGFTYEQRAIEEWLRSHNTSPKTNAQLETRILIPNRNLKILIEDWKDRNA